MFVLILAYIGSALIAEEPCDFAKCDGYQDLQSKLGFVEMRERFVKDANRLSTAKKRAENESKPYSYYWNYSVADAYRRDFTVQCRDGRKCTAHGGHDLVSHLSQVVKDGLLLIGDSGAHMILRRIILLLMHANPTLKTVDILNASALKKIYQMGDKMHIRIAGGKVGYSKLVRIDQASARTRFMNYSGYKYVFLMNPTTHITYGQLDACRNNMTYQDYIPLVAKKTADAFEVAARETGKVLVTSSSSPEDGPVRFDCSWYFSPIYRDNNLSHCPPCAKGECNEFGPCNKKLSTVFRMYYDAFAHKPLLRFLDIYNISWHARKLHFLGGGMGHYSEPIVDLQLASILFGLMPSAGDATLRKFSTEHVMSEPKEGL